MLSVWNSGLRKQHERPTKNQDLVNPRLVLRGQRHRRDGHRLQHRFASHHLQAAQSRPQDELPSASGCQCHHGSHTNDNAGRREVQLQQPSFYGKVSGSSFALAHNGVLMNDGELQQKYRLPKTNIQTDSYVAVQLLEKQTDCHLRVWQIWQRTWRARLRCR